MKLSILPSLLLTGLVAAQAPSLFTLSQPTGGDNFGGGAMGQTFTPGIGVTPDPTPLTVLPLTHIRFYQGNLGANSPSAKTYLNIYDGNPNAGGNFVGSSYNFVSTVSPVFRSPMDWYFNNLPLSTTTEYWAVMSSTQTAGTFDIGCSLENYPRATPNPYTGGSGIVAGVVKHSADNDLKFEIEFYFGVQGALTTVGYGCQTSLFNRVASMRTQGDVAPVVGQPLTLETYLAPLNQPLSVILLGGTDLGGIDLAPIGMPGCPLHVDGPLLLVAPTDATGVGAAALGTVPNIPALIGGILYTQSFVADPANTNALHAVTSTAKRIVIGQ